MKFLPQVLLALTVSCAALHAQFTPANYTFNTFTNDVDGFWVNANGWTTTSVGGNFYVSNVDSSDGSNYIRFTDSGPGVGATASISNTFGTAATDDHFSLSFSYYSGNYWGMSVGVGADASQGITLNIQQSNPDTVNLTLGAVSLAGTPFSFTGVPWQDFKVDINLGANSGSGVATVFTRVTGDSTWNIISSLANINLGLDATRTATDSTNPLNWDTLWFHHEGAVSGIDNVAITPAPVPEPREYGIAFMVLLAMLIVARRRTQRI